MELKRILASDTRSATERATAMFGPDVLIISNHRVNGQTELVVAVDIEEQAQSLQALPEADAPNFYSQLSQIEVRETAPANSRFSASLQQGPEDARDYLRSCEMVGQIRDEIAAMRREFSISQQVSGWQAGLNISAELQPLFAVLAEAGVSVGLRALLLDTVKNMRSEHEALLAIRDQLVDVLERPSVPAPNKGVHLLAGPSGSGKTQMTAQLAGQVASVLGPQHVCVISYQDLRVGAWTQTQMLSSQMGIDCFRAPDAATLGLLLAELSHRTLILIDTPGVQMIERIGEVLALCPACVCHAIVPADASLVTLNRVLQASKVQWRSLMVSKLDESTQPWALLEFLCYNPLEISLAGTGDGQAALKHELTTKLLVDLAIEHLPLMPEAKTPVLRPRQVQDAPPQRHFSLAAPWGMFEPFNRELHE